MINEALNDHLAETVCFKATRQLLANLSKWFGIYYS